MVMITVRVTWRVKANVAMNETCGESNDSDHTESDMVIGYSESTESNGRQDGEGKCDTNRVSGNSLNKKKNK
jgi:hypothetical protein